MFDIEFEMIKTVPLQCTLGEGLVWDERLQCLWFVDILESKLFRLSGDTLDLTTFDLPEKLGCFGLTPDTGRLICAFASGFAYYTPTSGEIEWIAKVEPEYLGVRMNDGRVDRQGRFWAGSMVEDEEIAPERRAVFYRLDPTDSAQPLEIFDGITVTNSTSFSPGGDQLYFADSPTQEIVRFDLDTATGELANRRSFARLPEGAFPDGSDVDADGRLWNAEWGAGRVTAYDPDGSIAAQLEVPASQTSCVTFGGKDLELLFVTSARADLSAAQLEKEPEAGGVFIYRTSVKGLPAPIFGG